jgi:hypothetical protein
MPFAVDFSIEGLRQRTHGMTLADVGIVRPKASANISIKGMVMQACDMPFTESGATPDVVINIQSGAPDIEFKIVDPGAAAGEYLSAEDPGMTVSVADPTDDIAMMRDAGENVLNQPSIRVRYWYPLGEYGPTEEEERVKGWIFEEAAPNGAYFTRADLARAVSARYHRIYAEDEEDGKYDIWGHGIGDLVLHTVSYDAGTGLYNLGIDS